LPVNDHGVGWITSFNKIVPDREGNLRYVVVYFGANSIVSDKMCPSTVLPTEVILINGIVIGIRLRDAHHYKVVTAAMSTNVVGNPTLHAAISATIAEGS
jgi:hypothetical protein